jgi:hypothetical protein
MPLHIAVALDSMPAPRNWETATTASCGVKREPLSSSVVSTWVIASNSSSPSARRRARSGPTSARNSPILPSDQRPRW